MGTQATRRDQKSKRILEEAERLAFEVGYRRFNMDELSQRLRMSKKTIYESFSSKDEIFTTALNRRAGKILRRMQEILDLNEAAMTKLYLMSKHIVDEVSHIKPWLVKEVETFFPEVFDIYGDFYRRIVSGVVRVIEEGMRTGEFRSDVNPLVFAYLMQGMVELARNPYLLIESGLTLEEVYTAFMKIILEGIISPQRRKATGETGGDGRAAIRPGGNGG